MKKILLTIFVLLWICAAFAQDSIQARKHIKYLSSKELHGRGVGYDGENKAAVYLKEQLEKFGVQPLCNGYFQSYEKAGFALEGTVEMKVDGKLLTPGQDYRIAPFSQSLHGKYKLIQIKPSVLINRQKLDKIVEKHKGDLSQSLIYFDDSKANFKNEKDKNAYQKVLQGLQYINFFQSAGIIEAVRNMPAWGLYLNDRERNFAYLYISDNQISTKSKDIDIHYNNELRPYTHHNVCGIIKGTEKPDTYIVLCAHYDHLGSMGEEVYFPGAHDNASGCAFLLNMAQYFSQNPPECSLVFLFFAGEESGLLGSKHFVENPLIPLEQIQYAVNFDLLGGGDDGITLVNSTEGPGKELYDRLCAINEKEQLLPKIAQRKNTANSDHYFFTKRQVPALFLYTMGGHTGSYHDPSDSNDNCSLTMFDNIFQLFKILIENS